MTAETTHKTPQLGTIDTGILCADCDRSLGFYDDALIDAVTNFTRLSKVDGPVWSLPTMDSDRFTKGLFAILWRASLSSRKEFQTFSLTPYENDVRDILLGSSSFSDKPDISLLVQRYTSKYFDPSRLYFTPNLAPLMGLQAGGIGLGGFRFIAKFDPRPLDSGLGFFDVTRSGVVRGTFVEIEGTPEFENIAQMVANDVIRSQKAR